MAVVVVAVAVVLLSASPPAVAQPWQYCGSSARYSPNSTYQVNLEAVSAVLPRNASSSPALFATAARGAAGGDDRVFALTLCRGDSDASGCLDCVADSFRQARGSCPLDKEVAVLYDACFLYFSGQDFLATTANVGQISLYNTPQNASADPRADALFTARVRALLNGTARWAAYGSARRFATARIWNGSVAAPVPTMYALAQCTPDLSPADCWGCLEDLVGNAPLAGGTIGARTAGVRCSYRYENYVFFRGVPMLNMGTPPSPTQPTPGRRSGSGKRKKQWIIVSIIVPLVGIFLCIFCFGWIRHLRKGQIDWHALGSVTRSDPVTRLRGSALRLRKRIPAGLRVCCVGPRHVLRINSFKTLIVILKFVGRE